MRFLFDEYGLALVECVGGGLMLILIGTFFGFAASGGATNPTIYEAIKGLLTALVSGV